MPYRIPPYKVEEVILAQDLKDIVGWGEKATHVKKAWKTTKGKGVTVAVLDTGADKTHVTEGDLQHVKMFDVTGTSPWAKENDWHGTHTCGIVGARANNKGVVGFAPECNLISIKALDNGTGRSEWIAAAIDKAAELKADVISMSFGARSPDPRIAEAIERAVSGGAICVAAAGNSGNPDDVNYPARWSGPRARINLDTIAVAATNQDGTLAQYSSRGPEVDVAAPGTNILSTWGHGGYARISGTSMACPAVAGVIALALSHMKKTDGTDHWHFSMALMRDVLRRSSIDMGPAGKDPGTGWGLIQADTLLSQKPERKPAPGEYIFGGIKVHVPAQDGDQIGIVC